MKYSFSRRQKKYGILTCIFVSLKDAATSCWMMFEWCCAGSMHSTLRSDLTHITLFLDVQPIQLHYEAELSGQALLWPIRALAVYHHQESVQSKGIDYFKTSLGSGR